MERTKGKGQRGRLLFFLLILIQHLKLSLAGPAVSYVGMMWAAFPGLKALCCLRSFMVECEYLSLALQMDASRQKS